MVARLPEEAWCWRSDGEEGPAPWTLSVELQAQAVDSLNVLASDYRRQNEPSAVPRPQPRVNGRSKASSPEEIRSFFGRRVRVG